ncbi:MAG: MurR/RpiR family transcriptional regulator [Eubacteriales bacterium]|nr:MurR/RpiR family transcriptional regulator [Eubacteriales bacterium]
MNEQVVKLEFLIPTSPRAEKAVAEYMLNNISLISDMTLATLSEETSTSEATILRFCKRMGFANFIQLRQAFALASVEDSVDSPEAVSYSDSMVTICDKTIHSICHSLENTKVFFSDQFDQALDAILNAKSVYFFATGDALCSCTFACAKFNRVGISSTVCSDVVYQYETALRLTDKDVAIAISNSGRSSNVVRSIKLAKERNAFTICITQAGKSPLIKYSDVSLFTAPVELTIGRDSVTKRVIELAILESFYLGIINKGTKDYKQMLQNTMLSSEMNK